MATAVAPPPVPRILEDSRSFLKILRNPKDNSPNFKSKNRNQLADRTQKLKYWKRVDETTDETPAIETILTISYLLIDGVIQLFVWICKEEIKDTRTAVKHPKKSKKKERKKPLEQARKRDFGVRWHFALLLFRSIWQRAVWDNSPCAFLLFASSPSSSSPPHTHRDTNLRW